MENLINLQLQFEDADNVWFLVAPNYKILQYNKMAASNSIALHGKELSVGDSILDYARDTLNRVDSYFIACFGKAATGEQVSHKQEIVYDSQKLQASSEYTPVYCQLGSLQGISILVHTEQV